VPADHATPEGTLLDRERAGYLRDAVDALPERLRHVIVGCFFEERAMAELAADLGVSESRVSHMRAEGLSLVREAMDSVLEQGPGAGEPATGVAARRRAAYCATVAAASDYRARLDRPAPVRAVASA
jgi:RNA polymerase sigma factor for flagellar operon FliA